MRKFETRVQLKTLKIWGIPKVDEVHLKTYDDNRRELDVLRALSKITWTPLKINDYHPSILKQLYNYPEPFKGFWRFVMISENCRKSPKACRRLLNIFGSFANTCAFGTVWQYWNRKHISACLWKQHVGELKKSVSIVDKKWHDHFHQILVKFGINKHL